MSRSNYPGQGQPRHDGGRCSTHPSLIPVVTPNAPAALGPYSHAIKVGNLVFVSASRGADPKTATTVPGGIIPQTEQALANLKAIVEASGSDISRVVKTTLFLNDLNDFDAVNGVYARVFGNHKPARATIQVARLPKDALLEIDCIASL